MASAMVSAKGLTKYYGNFPAIENVSFDVPKGQILGFLGPNGSGKTTTMRILTGFMPPSSGTIEIAGYDVLTQSLEARKHIGYLPESVPLYTDMAVIDYLRFMGKIRGMNNKILNTRIKDVISICHIEDYAVTHIGKLSKGYRQRVGLAQAIIHEPDILFLDEPTIGIDPIQVVETRELIKELGREHTIIISSHILPEVGMICQRILIIHEGQVVAEDTPKNLSQRLKSTEKIELEIRGPANEIVDALRNLKGVNEVTHQTLPNENTFTVESNQSTDIREEISSMIVSKQWGLLKLNPISLSLEDIFLQLTKEAEEK